jgi:hypothetical protein
MTGEIFPRLQEPGRNRYDKILEDLRASAVTPTPSLDRRGDQPVSPWRKVLTEGNTYDLILADRRALNERRMLVNFSAAAKGDPDLAAQAMELGVEMEQLDMRPLPRGTIERNLPAVREIVERRRARDRMLAGFDPVLYRQMRDPDFAAIAYDDLPNLSLLEEAIGGLLMMTPLPIMFDIPLAKQTAKNMKRRFEVGHLQVGMARAAKPAFGRAFTATEQARIREFQQRMEELPQESPGIFSGLAYVIGQMAGNSSEIMQATSAGAFGGAAGGAVLGGGPASPLTALGGTILGGSTALAGAIMSTTADVEAGMLYIDLLEQGIELPSSPRRSGPCSGSRSSPGSASSWLPR